MDIMVCDGGLIADPKGLARPAQLIDSAKMQMPVPRWKRRDRYHGPKIMSTRTAERQTPTPELGFSKSHDGCCRFGSPPAAFGSCHTHSHHLSPPTTHPHTYTARKISIFSSIKIKLLRSPRNFWLTTLVKQYSSTFY